MKGRTQARFWKAYESLPASVQRLAKAKFEIWKKDPQHPSLGFDIRRNGACVVRVGDHYRAVGLKKGDAVIWFWIGTHEEYNRYNF